MTKKIFILLIIITMVYKILSINYFINIIKKTPGASYIYKASARRRKLFNYSSRKMALMIYCTSI